MSSRPAVPTDAAAICRIYNEGIAERVATFETRLRDVEEIRAWIDSGLPLVVVEDTGEVVAFAATFAYRPRECDSGIAEFSVYVDVNHRRQGTGLMAMEALIDAAERAGFWKLLSRVFPENTASRALLRAAGFREVGVYEQHGQLDGIWKDVVIVERLLLSNL